MKRVFFVIGLVVVILVAGMVAMCFYWVDKLEVTIRRNQTEKAREAKLKKTPGDNENNEPEVIEHEQEEQQSEKN